MQFLRKQCIVTESTYMPGIAPTNDYIFALGSSGIAISFLRLSVWLFFCKAKAMQRSSNARETRRRDRRNARCCHVDNFILYFTRHDLLRRQLIYNCLYTFIILRCWMWLYFILHFENAYSIIIIMSMCFLISRRKNVWVNKQ